MPTANEDIVKQKRNNTLSINHPLYNYSIFASEKFIEDICNQDEYYFIRIFRDKLLIQSIESNVAVIVTLPRELYGTKTPGRKRNYYKLRELPYEIYNFGHQFGTRTTTCIKPFLCPYDNSFQGIYAIEPKHRVLDAWDIKAKSVYRHEYPQNAYVHTTPNCNRVFSYLPLDQIDAKDNIYSDDDPYYVYYLDPMDLRNYKRIRTISSKEIYDYLNIKMGEKTIITNFITVVPHTSELVLHSYYDKDDLTRHSLFYLYSPNPSTITPIFETDITCLRPFSMLEHVNKPYELTKKRTHVCVYYNIYGYIGLLDLNCIFNSMELNDYPYVIFDMKNKKSYPIEYSARVTFRDDNLVALTIPADADYRNDKKMQYHIITFEEYKDSLTDNTYLIGYQSSLGSKKDQIHFYIGNK